MKLGCPACRPFTINLLIIVIYGIRTCKKHS